MHNYKTILVSFVNLFNHTLNEKVFDSIANRAIRRDKICIVKMQ